VSEQLVSAVREILKHASAPVEVGPRRSREQYALVPLRALNWLTEALTPDERSPKPFVSIAPTMQFGDPVINGTRLKVELIGERYWDLGEHIESEILEPYELTRGDVVLCCWYMARYGSRKWRKRWESWANQINAGWWSDLSTLPLPPHAASEEAGAS